MSDCAKDVAKGLSPAMRRAVLWCHSSGEWKDHRRKANSNDGVSETSLGVLEKRIVGDPRKRVAEIYTLVEHQFNAGEKEHGTVWRNTRYRLTPLGLLVRKHLENER